jgi:hypothetical protein
MGVLSGGPAGISNITRTLSRAASDFAPSGRPIFLRKLNIILELTIDGGRQWRAGTGVALSMVEIVKVTCDGEGA